jgi:hypothetical protein
MQEKSKRAVDDAHVVANPSSVAVVPDSLALRTLADQIAQLQVQQEQIRLLLEQAERRAGAR